MKFLLTSIILSFLFACQRDDATKIDAIIIDNTDKTLLANISPAFEVDTFRISSELDNLLAGTVHQVAFHDETMMLVSRRAGAVVLVDKNLRVLRVLDPPSPEEDRYSSLGMVRLNESLKRIEVYDQEKLKFDHFSLDGNYLNSESPGIDFFDRICFTSGTCLYEVERADLSYFFESVTGPHHFALFKDGSFVKPVFPSKTKNGTNVIPTNDFHGFLRVGDQWQYRKTFGETIYKIDQEGSYHPILRISFSGGNRFVEIEEDDRLKNKGMALYEEAVPYPWLAVTNQEKNQSACVYWQVSDAFLVWFDDGIQKNSPANYYLCDGIVSSAPRNYQNGWFNQIMTTYKFNLIQRLKDDKSISQNKLYRLGSGLGQMH